MDENRIEHDALGEYPVPKSALYGISTARSLANFAISQEKMPPLFITCYATMKAAMAEANQSLGLLDTKLASAIISACEEIIDGQHLNEFPLSIWQSGSGTQTNMNINEVIANRANQILGEPIGKKTPVHPNDHVNLSQSSNDTFPTCMHICFAKLIHDNLLPNLDTLLSTLNKLQKRFKDQIHIGRTHLQDALPIGFSQNMQTYAEFVSTSQKGLFDVCDMLYQLPLGGTAVGTGFGSPKGFAAETIKMLSVRLKLPFTAHANPSVSMSQHQALLSLSSELNTLAACYHKMANDIRWLSSGPRSGIGELILKENELGSSIMPGKVNPTQCESAAMICLRVIGNHNTLTQACCHGQLELNTYKPLILHTLHESCQLISDSIGSFVTFCLDDLQVNQTVCEKHLQNSLMLVTALRPEIGYDQCAKLAIHAHKKAITLRQAMLELKLMPIKKFDELTNPHDML